MSSGTSAIDPARFARWQFATVAETTFETSSARSLVLEIPDWVGHVAGQHIDIRLTAGDGYQATRSYSLSSGPGEPPQVTVERVDDGEVSPFLVDIARPGDRFEVRGPLGGYFVWRPERRPLVLIGGGSGIAPLRSMWRAGGEPVRLLFSARTADRVIFGEELAARRELDVTIHLTREQRADYESGRIDRLSISAVLEGLIEPAVYICGPTSFVESAATHAADFLDPGYPIRTERFG